MKILIVGLGSMGRRRLRNLRHLCIETIIGVDPVAERRETVMREQGIATFASLADALAEAPDAMVISTPPDRHLEFALQAATAGIHFFTEAGTTDDGLDEVLAAAARTGCVAAPSCTMRFHPAVTIARDVASSGRIGRFLTFTHHAGQYLPDWHPWEDYRQFYVSKRATGACREIVPFELCWLTSIVGRIDRVAGMRGKFGDLDADIDDVYQLLMTTADGITGHLLIDALARPAVRSFRLIGTEGTIEWSAAKKAVQVFEARTGAWTEIAEPPAQVEAGYSGMSVEGMYIEEMRAFVAAVRGEAPYPYTFEEDRNNLNALYAAERSSDEGCAVTIER